MREVGMALVSYAFIVMISFMVMPAHAMEITCYSDGKKIYHGYPADVRYADGIILFKEPHSKQRVYINADCVVRLDAEAHNRPKNKH